MAAAAGDVSIVYRRWSRDADDAAIYGPAEPVRRSVATTPWLVGTPAPPPPRTRPHDPIDSRRQRLSDPSLLAGRSPDVHCCTADADAAAAAAAVFIRLKYGLFASSYD